MFDELENEIPGGICVYNEISAKFASSDNQFGILSCVRLEYVNLKFLSCKLGLKWIRNVIKHSLSQSNDFGYRITNVIADSHHHS
jgi:hypothetical protein